MMENERKAEIKSYYSQELLDGVKPMDAETAEFLWNMMNGIGEQGMKADAESKIASRLKAEDERRNKQLMELSKEELEERKRNAYITSTIAVNRAIDILERYAKWQEETARELRTDEHEIQSTIKTFI